MPGRPNGPFRELRHRTQPNVPITGTVNDTWGAFAARVSAARNADGGFGPRPSVPSEPEPTALAAIALDDAAGRAWLAAHQADDGSVPFDAAAVVNDASSALAALALGPGAVRERALDHVSAGQARSTPSTESVPHDESVHGWAWTEGTFGWVEPTSRALVALRRFRPDEPAIADGVGMLRDRESVGGGWNYGNRTVFDEDLPPYAQTTAAALIALQGVDVELEARGLVALKRLWRAERSGGLSLAVATTALRLHRDADADRAERALFELFAKTGLRDDVVALAWAAIATGPGIGTLEVTAP